MARRKAPTPPPPEDSQVIEHRVIPPPAAQTIEVPAEMLLQIATGMEDEFEVASRFGFDSDRYTRLKAWAPFQQQVEMRRAELKSQGVTFRMQMAFMAEDLGKDVYRIAKSNDATLLQKLESFRTFTKLADLEPKASVAAQQGPAFSITINLSPPPPQEKVIGVEQVGCGADGRPEGTSVVDAVLVPAVRGQ